MTKDKVMTNSQCEVSLIILQITSILCAAVKVSNKMICDTK